MANVNEYSTNVIILTLVNINAPMSYRNDVFHLPHSLYTMTVNRQEAHYGKKKKKIVYMSEECS